MTDPRSAAKGSLVDRFICRREGHKPTLKFTRIKRSPPSDEPFRYFTTCARCGKWFEQEVDDAA